VPSEGNVGGGAPGQTGAVPRCHSGRVASQKKQRRRPTFHGTIGERPGVASPHPFTPWPANSRSPPVYGHGHEGPRLRRGTSSIARNPKDWWTIQESTETAVECFKRSVLVRGSSCCIGGAKDCSVSSRVRVRAR
jgi:hypothetical protein